MWSLRSPELQQSLWRHIAEKKQVLVLFGTRQGNSKQWALQIAEDIEKIATVEVRSIAGFTVEDLVQEKVVLFFLSTYDNGVAPPDALEFCQQLEEFAFDFRVSKGACANVQYAVVGFGSDVYAKSHFCTCSKQLDKHMVRLSARRLLPIQCITDTKSVDGQIAAWRIQVPTAIEEALRSEPAEEEEVPDMPTESEASEDEDIEEAEVCGPGPGEEDTRPEMVTKRHRAQLTKEGYKLIGTHSAVKICRWTKHQLRGRGGCYKHTMYGITSYQCMEATPSLACANKCVFCWRHHKNPVGKSWKWKMDDPQEIVEEAINLHVKSIKTLRGVPGVKPERFAEAMTVRHCALSLVGEPIMYPRINEMVDELHNREISTFLVTNAQFPEAIKNLRPVTQLYVSVDAAKKDELKAIDRPLFDDFWERFLDSMDALREKRQRTVYRMTLVSDYNMADVDSYAKLVERGFPDFIEIKAVTFCGNSPGSDLTMKNVPWHDDVVAYGKAMLAATPYMAEHYDLAAEHRHSCCIILAKKDYYINDAWHTWIDYPKFHQLIASGEPFTGLDYMAPTPHWAVYGAAEEGFDPIEVRHHRNKKKDVTAPAA